MQRPQLPERWRHPVLIAFLVPVFLLIAAYMGQQFLDDRFGDRWTFHLCAIIIVADLVAAGVPILIFKRVPQKKSSLESVKRLFWWTTGIGIAFILDAIFEALVYPAFALHGWEPERYLTHAIAMLGVGAAVIYSGFATRRTLIRKLHDEAPK